jgi:hypothetical protein
MLLAFKTVRTARRMRAGGTLVLPRIGHNGIF